MKIINKTKNIILAEEIIIADSLFARMKGLLGRKEIKKGQALILKPCNSIHTFFMHFPIDVIFIGKDNHVVKAISSIRPFSLSGIYFASTYAIELPTDTVEFTHTAKNDLIEITT